MQDNRIKVITQFAFGNYIIPSYLKDNLFSLSKMLRRAHKST